MKELILIVLLAVMTTPGSAASLTLSELPGSFVSRILTGEFQMNFVDGSIRSDFETDGFAAYSYLSDSGVHFLLDYNVASGSHWGDGFGNSDDLSGSVFLAVALTYDLNVDGHEIDIYFDELMPDIGSEFFFSGLPYTTVIMDASAIASGQGVYMFSGEPDYIPSGSMNFGDPSGWNHPRICIECRLIAELNLVYLDYSTGFISFDPDDPRSGLFMGQDTYDTMPYGWDLGINIQSVPLPGALILFASALLGLRISGRGTRQQVKSK